MAMSEADQKNGGQVMMKFLLLDDVDNRRVFEIDTGRRQ